MKIQEIDHSANTPSELHYPRHMRIMHQEKRGLKLFPCELCEEKFEYNYKLKVHMLKIHTDKPSNDNTCVKCDRKFDYPSDYIKHYQETHSSLPPEYIDKETFVCDQCPRYGLLNCLDFRQRQVWPPYTGPN